MDTTEWQGSIDTSPDAYWGPCSVLVCEFVSHSPLWEYDVTEAALLCGLDLSGVVCRLFTGELPRLLAGELPRLDP